MASLARTFVLVLFAALAAAGYRRPHYLECVDSADCHGYRCCVFTGKGMYSMPKCLPLGEIGAKCNKAPDPETLMQTKNYPGGTVNFTNVYTDRCPCELGLVCDSSLNTCQDPMAHENYNDITAEFEFF